MVEAQYQKQKAEEKILSLHRSETQSSSLQHVTFLPELSQITFYLKLMSVSLFLSKFLDYS